VKFQHHKHKHKHRREEEEEGEEGEEEEKRGKKRSISRGRKRGINREKQARDREGGDPGRQEGDSAVRVGKGCPFWLEHWAHVGDPYVLF